MKAFHAHLDVCKRCATQPFNLCPIGTQLIKAVLNRWSSHVQSSAQ